MSIKGIVLILSSSLLANGNLYSAEGMPQFNADTFPSQLFWLIISFTSLYLIINFLILPRVRDNIRLRKNKISNDIERAQILKSQIEKIIEEYELKIDKSKNRASQTLKNAADKATAEFNSQLDTVKKRINQKIIDAEKETQAYKMNISNEINVISREISSLLVKKVLGKGLSKEDIDFIDKQSLIIKETL